MQTTHETLETNESLGTFLRKAREGKNVSIEQVAYATRISLKMLRALEEDDHTALPAPTFVRGYLQAYAKYVRIDTQDLLLRYQHHLATAPDAKRGAIRSHYLYVRERYQEKRRLVSAIVLFTGLLAIVGAILLYKAQRDKHKRLAHTADQIQKSEEQKPVAPAAESPLAKAPVVESAKEPSKETATKASEATKPVEPPKAEAQPLTKPPEKATEPPKAAEKAPEPAKPAPAPEPPKPAVVAPPAPTTADAAKAGDKKNYQLMLKATDDVWFRYQTDEDEVKDLTLRSGKQMLLRANKVVKIFSGNLGALSGTLNGKDLGALATSKGVKSAVLPESETANYKLPLFPQFQVKHAPKANAAPQDNGAKPAGTNENSPAN
jgi:cytoskeleton protein RodZ